MTTDRSSDEAGEPPKPSARSSRPPRSRTTAASSSTSSSDALRVGRVGRPHGLDGSFYVVEPDAQLPGGDGVVIVEGVARRIVRRSGTTERPILRFEGASSRDDALALRGAELTDPARRGDARGGRVLGVATSRAAPSSTATSRSGSCAA